VFWLHRITLYGSGRSNRMPVQRLCCASGSHRPCLNPFQSLWPHSKRHLEFFVQSGRVFARAGEIYPRSAVISRGGPTWTSASDIRCVDSAKLPRFLAGRLPRRVAPTRAGADSEHSPDRPTQTRHHRKQQQRQQQQQKPFLGSAAPRARKGFPQSSALRCAPFVQTKGLSTLAALRCKPWEIPLPLQLLPPQAWAWAKA
jgi:hypothetical protein